MIKNHFSSNSQATQTMVSPEIEKKYYVFLLIFSKNNSTFISKVTSTPT